MTARADATATNPLHAFPRLRLMPLSRTPLQFAERLSAAAGTEIWLKRDDLTGLGAGGNKVRGLEYLLGRAQAEGADSVVTDGSLHSNWAALAALAARMANLEAWIALYGAEASPTSAERLIALADAHLYRTGSAQRSSTKPVVVELAERLRRGGRRPVVLPRGGAEPIGCLGYVRATFELADQLDRIGVEPSAIWLANASGAMHAGLLAGHAWLHLDWPLVGVAVSRPPATAVERTARLVAGVHALVGAGSPRTAAIVCEDGRIGPDGVSPDGVRNAIALMARTEGVLLDPHFTGPAMARLLKAIRAGLLRGPVLFIVSGGAPALFDEEAR